VVLQLAIQIMSSSSLHGNGSRGGSGGFANIRDLLLSIALHLGDGSSVGSFHSVESRFLLFLGSGGGLAKILQGGGGGSGGCRGGSLLLLKLKSERRSLLLRLRLKLGQGDLRLRLQALQVHFALNLQVAESCCLLGGNSNRSGKLFLYEVLGFDQVSSTLLLSAELIVGAGHLLSNLRLNCVDFLHIVAHDLGGRWGVGRWRRRKSAVATSSSSTDDVDVDVASGSAVERAELGGASGVRNARQLAVVRRLIDLVSDGVDFGIISCKTGGAHELGHLLLSFNGVNRGLERDHAGHDYAGAEQDGCCRPLHAALLGD